LKATPLEAAYKDGFVNWHGQHVPLHYLSSLLGDSRATPVGQRYTPVLILKSGYERVAVHVDEVIGNREVVVKNIGPQLARMPGIAGATVLGSGDIVLILNPVPLAQRFASQAERKLMETPEAATATVLPAEGELHVPLTPQNASVASDQLVVLPEEVVPEATSQTLRKMPIVMVVDDSLTVRKVTQRFLVREGYQVVLAKDGVDALEQLQTLTPDLMLVDIEMPRMDGFDLTRNVRNDERTVNTPIIMITSRTADKHRNYALELGVNAYFGKPFQEDKLLEAISGFVHKV
jgi:chemosensory pili system protein ChpA (sensor histidine kinase/response regulator)